MDLHGFSWIFFKVYTFEIWRKKSEKENSIYNLGQVL